MKNLLSLPQSTDNILSKTNQEKIQIFQLLNLFSFYNLGGTGGP